MKRFVLIMSAVAVMFSSLTSCDDLLEEQNYGNPTIEDMMTNPENVVLLVGQSYADLKWIHDHWGYWGVNTLTSDEGLCPIRMPGEHWNDGAYWRRLNDHSWNQVADSFKLIWNSTISGAVRCNQTIQTITDYKASMTEEEYLQFLGELEVLRSYYYYLLFDSFGRIPYTESYDEKSQTEPLMEPANVWSHLVEVLERNAPNMVVVTDSNRAQNYGRVTQGFAHALLARLYLNAESFGCTAANVFPESHFVASEADWTADEKESKVTPRKVIPASWQADSDFYNNCVRCCNEVINSGSYRIESDFFANFLINNEGSKENIMVIVEDGRSGFDERSNGSMSSKLRIVNNTLHYEHQYTWGMLLDCWNGYCARPSFIDLYDDDDVRGPGWEGNGTKNTKRWGWFVGPVYTKDGSAIAQHKNDENREVIIVKDIALMPADTVVASPILACSYNSGARQLKYEADKGSKYMYNENDFVLMRYADVLWMKREAINLHGAKDTSVGNYDADFQLMMSRAFVNGDGKPAEKGAADSYASAYGDPASFTAQQILDERGREFSWEMVRRRDLIRHGKFSSVEFVSKDATQKYREWFPIPYSVLLKGTKDENGNDIWTQNDGYAM